MQPAPAHISLLFPHQLYLQHPALAAGRPVVMVEEWLFFRQYAFHKQKLILHRASMQAYAEALKQQGYTVWKYVDALQPECDIRLLVPWLAAQGVGHITTCLPDDDWLERRLTNACRDTDIALTLVDNPGFLTPLAEAHAFFNTKKQYFQTDFYVWQRKRMGLLLEANGKPLGGKWTYDTDNRQRYPKGMQPPPVLWPAPNAHVAEAQQFVETHFADNPGRLNPVISIGYENCFYPVTHTEARQWLNDFLQHRFAGFGPYEDAMVARERFLHHSVLTPMLNIGLLTPAEVLDATLSYAAQNDIPLPSLEGFVRQIIGWREFIRLVYLREGGKQRTTNYWGFTRKIPASFYTGHTGIEPIDIVIRKTLESGYCHHIERLMVLGNFMLLCEFDPDEVYRWFMELFIDSYDWVMVPNVYGMTQFADGGLMTTKPYISGSAYLMKMGDWGKGPWQQTWDGLFWHFMNRQRSFFAQNPRLGMLLNTFDKMQKDKRDSHLLHATNYLAAL